MTKTTKKQKANELQKIRKRVEEIRKLVFAKADELGNLITELEDLKSTWDDAEASLEGAVQDLDNAEAQLRAL